LDSEKKRSILIVDLRKGLRRIGILALMVLPLLVTLAGGCAGNKGPDDISAAKWEFYNERVEAFVEAMAAGDFNTAAKMFDATMKRALPATTLQNEIWSLILRDAGAFVAINKIRNALIDGYYVCYVTSKHEISGVTLRVVFSEDGLVAGFYIDGYPTIAEDVVQREGFVDYAIVVGEGTEFPLEGILSIPDDVDGPVPAVVIVHGSGQQDMDLTMYINKPYRDIAEYLASNGIAVIRYNKRTFVHGAKYEGSWTVWEETIEDAILAAEMLKADPRIDENRVFMIGHSLGGSLAPRIHALGGDFAGLIILAGSPRFLLDLSKDQNIALIEESKEGEEREAALAELYEFWDTQILELLSLPDAVAKNSYIDSGTSAYYFKDLYNNPITAYLESAKIPMLIMQGSKDMQVMPDVDFALYQEVLASRTDVTFKLYEGLNHLFMTSLIGTFTGILDEYQIAGRVDDQFLADIAQWVKAH